VRDPCSHCLTRLPGFSSSSGLVSATPRLPCPCSRLPLLNFLTGILPTPIPPTTVLVPGDPPPLEICSEVHVCWIRPSLKGARFGTPLSRCPTFPTFFPATTLLFDPVGPSFPVPHPLPPQLDDDLPLRLCSCYVAFRRQTSLLRYHRFNSALPFGQSSKFPCEQSKTLLFLSCAVPLQDHPVSVCRRTLLFSLSSPISRDPFG